MTDETVLTSADREPGIGTLVLDHCGITWINSGYYPIAWMPTGGQGGDPESWIKVAGNYGPVKVVTEL